MSSAFWGPDIRHTVTDRSQNRALLGYVKLKHFLLSRIIQLFIGTICFLVLVRRDVNDLNQKYFSVEPRDQLRAGIERVLKECAVGALRVTIVSEETFTVIEPARISLCICATLNNVRYVPVISAFLRFHITALIKVTSLFPFSQLYFRFFSLTSYINHCNSATF